MFLSLSEKFVFLGNRKAASTSMESFLRLRCEICASGGRELSDGGSAKHMNYADWLRAYEDFFRNIRRGPEHFLVFGIIRDPLARIVSSYSFRNRHSKRPRSPDQFVAAMSQEEGGVNPDAFLQRNFFAGANGEIGANFLIRLEQQEEDLDRLNDETGLDLRGAFGEQRNAVEPAEFKVESSELRQWLDDYLEVDRKLYNNQGGRLLRPVEPSGAIKPGHAMRILLRTNPGDLGMTFLFNLRARQAMDMKPHVLRVLKVARNATGKPKHKKATANPSTSGKSDAKS